MKITSVQPILCDGGFRPWTFVKVTTDAGIIGYGDCTDWGSAVPVASCITDLEPLVLGKDPADIEAIWWTLYRKTIRSLGGIAHKAMAGINSALWDIKGKRLGVPVYDLLGGRMRDSLPLYWTHCASGRNQHWQTLGLPPVRDFGDVGRMAEEAVSLGFTAIKTNIFRPGEAREFLRVPDGSISPDALRAAVAVVDAFRKYGGPDLGIALDVGFSYNMGAAIKLARALEPYNMMWLETETLDAESLRTIRESTTTTICTGESLYQTHGYKPFLEAHAVDVVMPDLAWNGISMGKKIADYAETYDIPVAPPQLPQPDHHACERARLHGDPQLHGAGVRLGRRALAQRRPHRAPGHPERAPVPLGSARAGRGPERNRGREAPLSADPRGLLALPDRGT